MEIYNPLFTFCGGGSPLSRSTTTICCSPWPHRPIIDTYSLTIYPTKFVVCAWNGLLRPPTTNITLLTLSFIITWPLTHSALCLYSYQNVHRTEHIAAWQPLYATTDRHHSTPSHGPIQEYQGIRTKYSLAIPFKNWLRHLLPRKLIMLYTLNYLDFTYLHGGASLCTLADPNCNTPQVQLRTPDTPSIVGLSTLDSTVQHNIHQLWSTTLTTTIWLVYARRSTFHCLLVLFCWPQPTTI